MSIPRNDHYQLDRPHLKCPCNVREPTSSSYTIKIVQLEKDKEKLTNEIEDLRKHIKQLQQVNKKTEVTRLVTQNKSLQIEVNKLRNEKKDLCASNEELESENKDLREELENGNKDLRASSEKLKEQNRDLKGHNENLESENKDLKGSSEKLENENKHLRASIEKLESENKDLREKNKNHNQQISWSCKQLEVLKNSSESELSKMGAKISQLNQKMEKLKSLTKELTKEVNKGSDYSKQLARRNDQLNEEIELLRGRIELIKEERDCKAQDVRKFEHMLDTMTSKKDILFAEHAAKLEKDIMARMDKYSTRMQSVISIIVYASDVLRKINAKKLEDEEESYKFTNAFTSAGEGSILDISKRYRHLQHNMRASAVRASKKVYKVPAKTFFCSQTLNAYEVAKNVLLEESGKCICMHLVELQPSDKTFNDKMLKACMRIIDYIATDEIANDAIKRITEELKCKDAEERCEAAKDDPLPPDVANYYHNLAELTWQAISRPIPMVYGMEEQRYKKEYHDLKDGESDDEGEPIAYIYPVLYSSNQWPRQIAQMGRVEIKPEE